MLPPNKFQKSSTSSHLDFIMSTPIVLTFLCALSIWLLDGENLETNKKNAQQNAGESMVVLPTWPLKNY
jgi:hypothetical protein